MFRVESIRTPWIIVNHVTPPKFEGWTSKNNRKTSSNNQQGHTHMKRRLTIEVLSTWICFLLQDILCQWHVPILRRDVQGAVAVLCIHRGQSVFHGRTALPVFDHILDLADRFTPAEGRMHLRAVGTSGCHAAAAVANIVFPTHTHTVTHMIYM